MAVLKKSKPTSKLDLKKQSVHDESLVGNMKFSFQYFEPSQKFASSFKDWQQIGLLSKTLETFCGYSKRPLRAQIDGDKFAIYGAFPPADKTMFDFPVHIPEDAEWGRIHINNKSVVVGHIVGDTFYVVFLDKTHKFWLTKRVTGK